MAEGVTELYAFDMRVGELQLPEPFKAKVRCPRNREDRVALGLILFCLVAPSGDEMGGQQAGSVRRSISPVHHVHLQQMDTRGQHFQPPAWETSQCGLFRQCLPRIVRSISFVLPASC